MRSIDFNVYPERKQYTIYYYFYFDIPNIVSHSIEYKVKSIKISMKLHALNNSGGLTDFLNNS